ncbi:hypothetical protein [Sphingobacterium sp. UBA1498]|uniref:hypothetical protein n=1 Tax=Sphingobacterium sp. UBA1498 TaxID=1947481 RepID=UPI0025D50AC9|nr:hypothetical protein [Sphingobacterium sp. UBA1498]
MTKESQKCSIFVDILHFLFLRANNTYCCIDLYWIHSSVGGKFHPIAYKMDMNYAIWIEKEF